MSTAAPLNIAPDKAPADVAPAVRCTNCAAPVPGRYCGACGQRLEPPLHSLWHLLQVATEDLTHADSRLWRTLAALLFKPGYLTAEFLAGRRARYLPPVRLYLVLSVAFFLFAAATQPKLVVLKIDASNRMHSELLSSDEDKEIAAAMTTPKPGETAEQRAQRLCGRASYDGPWAKQLAPLVPNACRRVLEDSGRSLQEALLHNVPRAMFLFLPLLSATMMLMYWWPRRYYVEHLLLLVHNHAFVFLVVMLAWVVTRLLPGIAPGVGLAVSVYFVWYMYRSMRVAYRQGRLLTFSKLALLSFFYLVSGAIMLALTSVYSALSL
ncbi:MAG TPA: DUF3667 domain-containing protein [Steroidobacteraceae bacterium]